MKMTLDNPSGDAARLVAENQELHVTIAALTSRVAELEESVSFTSLWTKSAIINISKQLHSLSY